jgi:predicted nucleic acid-binding protein
MTILLDTNAYTALLQGHCEVASRVRSASRVLFSMVVIGELLAGFRHGSRRQENLRMLDEFLHNPRFETVPVTRASAERFALIWRELRRKGRPIPTNDIWIAAHAMETGAELISFDRHFGEVSGLLWLLV